MIKRDLLTELLAPQEYLGLGWRQDEAGTWIAARITDTGLQVIGAEARAAETMPAQLHSETMTVPPPEAFGGQPVGPQRASTSPSLRAVAHVLLAAWDAPEQPGLAAAFDNLRTVLPHRPTASGGAALRMPREGTIRQRVLALLSRPEGTTVAQIMEATAWAQHTVRGFLAGLKNKGHTVEVLERVRQVGQGSQGAKGSYSIYCIGGEQD
jgi:hypothetical protein